MNKFLVRMNYVVSYSTEFVVEGDDEEEVQDVIGSMDSEFLEKTLPWSCSNYEEPVIEDFDTISDDESRGKTLMNRNPLFTAKYNQTKKEIYETDQN